jgi:hypothetical protein
MRHAEGATPVVTARSLWVGPAAGGSSLKAVCCEKRTAGEQLKMKIARATERIPPPFELRKRHIDLAGSQPAHAFYLLFEICALVATYEANPN